MSNLENVQNELVFLNPAVYFLVERYLEEQEEPILIGSPKMKMYVVGITYSASMCLKISGNKTYYFDYNMEDSTILLYIGNGLKEFDRKDNTAYLQSIFDDVFIPFMRDAKRGLITSHGSVHNTVGKSYTIYLNHNYKVLYKV